MKASKLDVPAERGARAVDAILDAFPVIPSYRGDVVAIAHRLKEPRDHRGLRCASTGTATWWRSPGSPGL